MHARCQPGIVDLHALDIMCDQKGPPAIMDIAAIREKLEITLDHARQPIGLGDRQAEAIFVEGAITTS